jgi:glycine/D-amino acid oxidase-like deaminating enzyme
MYDVIAVGARYAGASTALLARRGYRVLLVDCATFPEVLVDAYDRRRRGPV